MICPADHFFCILNCISSILMYAELTKEKITRKIKIFPLRRLIRDSCRYGHLKILLCIQQVIEQRDSSAG